MTLETFFEKFELLAEAPNAVAKLRELILQLATQGRLVAQDGTDEPAFALLGRIQANLDRLRRKKEIRSNPVPEAEQEFATLPELPGSWQWVALGNVVEYGSSDKVESSEIPASAWLLDLEDIEKDTSKLLRRKAFAESPSLSTKTRFDQGAVLYGKLRPYLNKVLVADAPGYCTTEIIPIQTFGLIDQAYLCLALKRKDFLTYAVSKSYGMNLPRLGTEDARCAPFPLPPLAEQRRIVAKVDELMALCDRLEAQQKERDQRHAVLSRASLARFAESPTPANLDYLFHPSYPIPPADLRKAILTLAVQGKLVPQDPNDEPAASLMAAVSLDKARALKEGRMRNTGPIPAYGQEYPFLLPPGWVWGPLGALTAAEDGALCDGPFGSKLKTEHYIPTGGYAVLRLGNIGEGTFIYGKEGYIDRAHFESLPGNHAMSGDLLVAGLADPLVRCCEVPADVLPAVNKSDCFRLRLHERIDRTYVRHYLNSPIAKMFAAKEHHGMTRERINLANAKALPVPVPPLSEQRRIVSKIDQLLIQVDDLGKQLSDCRTTGAQLLRLLGP